MTGVFSTVLDMTVKAGVVIVAILLMRLLLLKAPKKFSYMLWSVAAFRLCVPVSFQAVFSIFSLRQSVAVAPATPPAVNTPVVHTTPPSTVPTSPVVSTPTVTAPPATVPTAPMDVAPTPTLPVDTAVPQAPAIDWESVLTTVFAVIWLVGLAAMVVYGIVSYVKLYRRMQNAVRIEGNIYASDRISSPFTLGFVKPRIYLPFGLTETEQTYIVAHERYHIKRLDHIVKPFAYLLLAVHWFNPLCWLAFNRMSMDMEMSCDEAILRRMSEPGSKAQYTETLLAVASANRFPAPSPLAFNDGGGAKQRIKHALNWKKPKTWMTVIACLLCVATLAACAADKVVPKDGESDVTVARALTAEELSEVESFLNDAANNGLISSLNVYTRPENIDLYFALSEGAGIGRFHTELEEAPQQAVVNAPGYTEFAPCLVFAGADIEAYLQKKLGLSLADLADGSADLDYVQEHDLYFLQHTDYNGCTVDVTAGEIDKDGRYVVTYTAHEPGKPYVVTLCKTADGYQFLSNVEAGATAEEALYYTLPLTLGWVPDSLMNGAPDTLYYTDDKAQNTEHNLVFASKGTVRGFRFIEVDEAETLTAGEVLYAMDELTEGVLFIASTYLNDATANRGISFLDVWGQRRYYAIRFSGKDGSLSLEEFGSDRVRAKTRIIAECEAGVADAFEIDVTFDGEPDLLIAQEPAAAGVWFETYVWDAEESCYWYADNWTLVNFALDTENQRILSYNAGDMHTVYTISRWDEENREPATEHTLSWGWRAIEENGQLVEIVEFAEYKNGEGPVAEYTLTEWEDVYELDKTDERFAPYFEEGSLWDLDNEKWRNFALAREFDSTYHVFGPMDMSDATAASFYGTWEVKELLGFTLSYNDASEYPTGQDVIGNRLVLRKDRFSSMGITNYPVYQAECADPEYIITDKFYDTDEFFRRYKVDLPGVEQGGTVTVINPRRSETVADIPLSLFMVNRERLILCLECTFFELTRVGE